MDHNIVDSSDSSGLTWASQAAAEYGYTDIVQLLSARGADPATTPSAGQTASDKEAAKASPYVNDLEVIDPACESATDCQGESLKQQEDGTVVLLGDNLETMKVPRTGIVTDGVTRLLLRIKTNQGIKLLLQPPSDAHVSSACEWGTLSLYDGTSPSCKSSLLSPGKDNEYVFALYQAPVNFPSDPAHKTEITIKTIALSTGEERVKKLELVPPPVVFIHGVWSSKDTWPKGGCYEGTLCPEGVDTLLKRYGFTAYFADYKVQQAATFNPQSSSIPIELLVGETNLALYDYRKKGIAISQVDVVAHSMGGLITRARTVYATDDEFYSYKKTSNYMRGDIHKIITIGTPHQGSPLANVFLECKDVRDAHFQCTTDPDCMQKWVVGCIRWRARHFRSAGHVVQPPSTDVTYDPKMSDHSVS